MAKNVYYFQIPREMAEFINAQGNQTVRGHADHFKNYADAWSSIESVAHPHSKLGLGPNLNQRICIPDLAVIYGQQMSPLFAWAYKEPKRFHGEIQPHNIVSASVHFAYEVLHNSVARECTVDKNGALNYTPAFMEAFRRYKELDNLAKAVDGTSEAFRKTLDMTSVTDQMRLRDVYTSEGHCRLRTQDLMSLLTNSVTKQMVESLPLEFTMRAQEFQIKAHNIYMHYSMEISDKPTSTEKRCLESLDRALQWLGDAVKQEDMCTSQDAWDAFGKITGEIKELNAKVTVEPDKSPRAMMVEWRPLGKYVNQQLNVTEPIPTFDRWSAMNQFIQQQTVHAQKEDPLGTGYFMIYRGIAPEIHSEMSLSDVSLTSSEVYLLGNGLFQSATYTIPEAIIEHEKRLATIESIKDFAEEHGLDPRALLEWPLKESEQVRDAFAPGGLLENGHIIESVDVGRPELKPMRNIQRLLCGEHATFDTVRAALLVEESYTKNLYSKIEAGMSTREAIRQEVFFALKDAEHYTQFEPSMPHNDELYRVFHSILEAHRTEGKDECELLEWYVDGCLEEFEHEDV